jgi:hypothetical protein
MKENGYSEKHLGRDFASLNEQINGLQKINRHAAGKERIDYLLKRLIESRSHSNGR